MRLSPFIDQRASRLRTPTTTSGSGPSGPRDQVEAVKDSARPRKARSKRELPTEASILPPQIAAWFARRGWKPRAHQLALLEAARARRSTLLIAPTGAGKTLAGFLPSLVAL